ncbi:MAG: hypothetical protein LBJ00_03360 [Planctomycetaceae bacterium]|jgi:hypothetical protein|nr:hypothetical protein [Planctomycetaceae bacterium]
MKHNLNIYSICLKFFKAEHASVVSRGSCSMAKFTAHTGYGIITVCVTFILISIVVGCSGNVRQSGQVIFDDGSPVPCGTICFLGDKYQASGDIQTDGTFIIGSTKQGNGLLPGKYKVIIAGSQKVIGTGNEGQPLFEELVDGKFTNPKETPLSAVVKGNNSAIRFKVEKFKK